MKFQKKFPGSSNPFFSEMTATLSQFWRADHKLAWGRSKRDNLVTICLYQRATLREGRCKRLIKSKQRPSKELCICLA
jgi:hypothetical protein